LAKSDQDQEPPGKRGNLTWTTCNETAPTDRGSNPTPDRSRCPSEPISTPASRTWRSHWPRSS